MTFDLLANVKTKPDGAASLLTDVLEGACTVLVVDPPWSYGRDTGRTRTAEKHYQTIGHNGGEINRKTGAGIEGIVAVTPVPTFAAKNCHLYLWTTNPKLPFAFDVMKAWGFEYKTTLTWVKTKAGGGIHGGGMGWFFRGATEHVLFGVKGSKGIPSAMRKPNIVMAGTGEHSEKPVEFYDLLRSIYGENEVMADLYARKAHDRFHAWGNEAPSNMTLAHDEKLDAAADRLLDGGE